MRHRAIRTALFATVTALGLAVVPGAPARASTPAVAGRTCSFSSVTDPAAPDRQTGEMNGGPLAVAETSDPAANPLRVTLTCTIQVGGANWNHLGADAAAVSASGVGAAAVPPTPVSYESPDGQPVYLCTELTLTDAHGGTRRLYLDSSKDSWESGYYSTDPAVECRGAQCQAISRRCMALLRLLDYVVGAVDGQACPILASVAPGVPGLVEVRPDGDVYVADVFVWDCPPYDW